MLTKHILAFLKLLCSALAVNLYVASYSSRPSIGADYAGNITTLSSTQNPDGSYLLSQSYTLNTSTNSPSWLTLNKQNNILYLVDEAIGSDAKNGTLVSYRTSQTGQLTELMPISANVGGVYATFFASGMALAVPHYTGSLLQTYNICSTGHIADLQTFNFTNEPSFKPGPVQPNQAAPHPHEAILDPTEQYLLLPDLGADVVRIFSIDQASHKLTSMTPLQVAAGTGPRHGAFSRDTIAGSYFFYLVGELAGTVTAYRIDYTNSSAGGITFNQVGVYDTLNATAKFPKNPNGSTKVAPAEIALTPDGSTVIVSNRNDTTFGVSPPIDSLVSYTISPANGTLTKLPLVSADGSFPRQFALNKAANLIAIGLQNSGIVSIKEKSAGSDVFDKEVANITLAEGINTPVCIVWDE